MAQIISRTTSCSNARYREGHPETAPNRQGPDPFPHLVTGSIGIYRREKRVRIMELIRLPRRAYCLQAMIVLMCAQRVIPGQGSLEIEFQRTKVVYNCGLVLSPENGRLPCAPKRQDGDV